MKTLCTVAVLALAVAPASANLLVNGTFDDFVGLPGWNPTGAASAHWFNEFGMPNSPSGEPFAGVITSWGGDWGGPMGTISQTVTLVGAGTLSGELYAAAHAGDAWRNVAVDVLWNGVPVASLARNADPNLWAQDFPWVPFSVPVMGVGSNTVQVNFTVHFAEWSWVQVDNLVLTPEPASLAFLALGGLATLRRKRR